MSHAQPITARPIKTRNQLPGVLRLSPGLIRRDIAAVDGFNAKVAVVLTKVVGTMWTFYVFNGIALISLPSAINSGNLTVLINWVSSNWIQLVLLPALMVGQNLESATADVRAEKTFEATEKILDRLDTHTAGGLRDVLEAVEGLKR
jgi:hypothetical protein